MSTVSQELGPERHTNTGSGPSKGQSLAYNQICRISGDRSNHGRFSLRFGKISQITVLERLEGGPDLEKGPPSRSFWRTLVRIASVCCESGAEQQTLAIICRGKCTCGARMHLPRQLRNAKMMPEGAAILAKATPSDTRKTRRGP